MTLRAWSWSVAVVSLAACERPPVVGSEPAPVTGTIDLAAFVADTPVIGSRWYEYESSSHVLRPKAQSYVVRIVDDGTAGFAYAAFAPQSYYDEQTGDSGLLTLSLSRFIDGAWTTATSLKLSQNVKTADICLDLEDGAEVACPAGHLRIETNPRLLPEAGLVVAEPSFSLPSLAGVAALDLVDGVVVPGAIADLPPPTALTGFQPHVSSSGMALGCDFLDDGKTRFFVLGRDTVAKVALTSTSIRFALAELDLAGPTIAAFAHASDVALDVPDADDARLIALTKDTPVTTVATSALLDPPAAPGFSFALFENDAGEVCGLQSAAAAVAVVDAAFDDAVVPGTLASDTSP